MGPDVEFSENLKSAITDIFKELRKNTGLIADLRYRIINKLENRLMSIQSKEWRTQSSQKEQSCRNF